MTTRIMPIAAATTLVLVAAAAAVTARGAPAADEARAWRADPAWHQGKAEWALYEAERPIYGVARRYEATIFTNTQRMDPRTGTKAEDWRAPGTVEVFKHNASELIPTENYVYRFLTTSFVRTDTLAPFKVAFSSQEDCGSTYRQFVVAAGAVRAQEFSYFPGDGARTDEYPAPAALAFHDALSLTLRDYPFDAETKPVLELDLVPDQTDTHAAPLRPARARVEHVERTTVTVPYGAVDAHHLRVTHEADGGTTQSDYWLAADPGLRHVMVRYEGPHGVRYALKKLGWWAYWDRSDPRPE